MPLPLPPTPRGLPAGPLWVTALHVDRQARLWVGTRVGVHQLDAAGRTARVYAHDPADRRTLPDTLVYDAALRALLAARPGGAGAAPAEGALDAAA